jgi:predicted anti-sigma-YlaC factor YlaD
MDGQIIAEHLKTCPACGNHYQRIVSKDADAAVLRCACGNEWTAYYERPRRLPNRMTV